MIFTDWIAQLSTLSLLLFAFSLMGFLAVIIYACVKFISSIGQLKNFQKVSPALMPLLGTLFALIVGFLAADVWSINARAQNALNLEASALQRILEISREGSNYKQKIVQSSVEDYIFIVVEQEWPLLVQRKLHINSNVKSAEALLKINLKNFDSKAFQSDMKKYISVALDARNERIQLSHMNIDSVKWGTVLSLSCLILILVSIIHVENSGAAFIAISIVVIASSLAIILVTAHARPYTGHVSIKPTPLLQLVN